MNEKSSEKFSGLPSPGGAAALCSVGAAELHYRELAAANHNAWDAAYADAMLWRWLGHQLDALPA